MTTFLTNASEPQHEGWLQLERSLRHFNWPYHFIEHEWRGWGCKITEVYNFLQSEQGQKVDFFFYSDAYDSFCLGTMDEALSYVTTYRSKPFFTITFAAEKACWPHGEWAPEFPDPGHQWKYLNGGGFYCDRLGFIRAVDRAGLPEKEDINDQEWWQNQYLHNNERRLIRLESKPMVFQPIGHAHDDDFMVRKGRLINLETLTKPVFIHGNGHTEMGHIYKLL